MLDTINDAAENSVVGHDVKNYSNGKSGISHSETNSMSYDTKKSNSCASSSYINQHKYLKTKNEEL